MPPRCSGGELGSHLRSRSKPSRLGVGGNKRSLGLAFEATRYLQAQEIQHSFYSTDNSYARLRSPRRHLSRNFLWDLTIGSQSCQDLFNLAKTSRTTSSCPTRECLRKEPKVCPLDRFCSNKMRFLRRIWRNLPKKSAKQYTTVTFLEKQDTKRS